MKRKERESSCKISKKYLFQKRNKYMSLWNLGTRIGRQHQLWWMQSHLVHIRSSFWRWLRITLKIFPAKLVDSTLLILQVQKRSRKPVQLAKPSKKQRWLIRVWLHSVKLSTHLLTRKSIISLTVSRNWPESYLSPLVETQRHVSSSLAHLIPSMSRKHLIFLW